MKRKYLVLTNRFQPSEDGWYQLAPFGEWDVDVLDEDAGTALRYTQVVDEEAGRALAADLGAEELLVDFDHFSLDTATSSEAAGWITALANRADGVYAQIRWSDVGEPAVNGGRYRYLSPVFPLEGCERLPGPRNRPRVRPRVLMNAGLTNQPRMKNRPISNRDNAMEVRMDAIKQALGLAEDADEASIVAAIEALKTSTDEVKAEAVQLKNRASALETEKAEREAEEALTEYAGVIEDKAGVKEQLLKNRAGTLVVLKGLKAKAAPLLPNRGDGKLPTLDVDGAEGQRQAAQIRARANAIASAEGISFNAAWNRAKAEIG